MKRGTIAGIGSTCAGVLMLLGGTLTVEATTQSLPLTLYALPYTSTGSGPSSIVSGPGNDLYFTEQQGHRIGKIDATTGAITEYPLPMPNVNEDPQQLTLGPDGNIWFTINSATGGFAAPHQVGRLDITSGAIAEFTLPGVGTNPYGIIAGHGELWLADPGGPAIYEMSTAGVLLNQYGTTTLDNPTGIAFDAADNLLWFADPNNGSLDSLDASSGAITTYPLPASAAAMNVVYHSGVVWFTQPGNAEVGSLSVNSGAISEYRTPDGAQPDGLTVNAGSIWFAESTAVCSSRFQCTDNVGVLNTSTGNITEYGVQYSSSALRGIVTGPDGNIWLPNAGTSSIDTLSPNLVVTLTADAPEVAAGTPFGYTIRWTNTAEFPGNATSVSLSSPLPPGTGIDWKIDAQDARACTVSGAVGSQTLTCVQQTLASLATYSVHVTSNTTITTVPGTYSCAATLSASNEPGIPPAQGATIINAPAPTPTPTATPSPTPRPTSAVQPTATPTPLVTRPDPTIPTPGTGAGGSGEQGLGLVLVVAGCIMLALPFLRRRACSGR